MAICPLRLAARKSFAKSRFLPVSTCISSAAAAVLKIARIPGGLPPTEDVLQKPLPSERFRDAPAHHMQ